MRSIAAVLVVLGGSAGFAVAEDRRSESAHVHGISRLDIAIEGGAVTMALTAPAADILGFEHEARTKKEKAALTDANAKLLKPLSLFTLSPKAGCKVVKAALTEQEHDDHEGHDHHEDHGHKKHGHEKHGHKAHGHDKHGHDDHGREKHAGHGHDDHAGEHDEEHSDLGASYSLTCSDAGALDAIAFPYFETFPNAEKIELRLITDKGQFAHTVERAAPSFDLSGVL